MNKQELINDTIQYITSSYGVPTKISDVEIENRIKDALRWFYRNYDYSVQTKWYVIPRSHFLTSEFRAKRSIVLPDCILSIAECKETYSATKLGLGDRDFSVSRLIAADIFLSSYSSDDLVNRVAYASYYDLSRAFFRDWVDFDFNFNTHVLYIKGSDPKSDVAIRTWDKIEEEALFDDPLFIDYIRGLALISLSRLMGFVTGMNLPGGAQFNIEMLKSEGERLIENVKTQIKENFTASPSMEFYYG